MRKKKISGIGTMNLNSDEIAYVTELAKPERDKGYTRTFYSYPAKFQAKLPRGLIERFSSEGELIFDPFVGGGTTGLEAMLVNRKFLGYDINSFAIFVSKVKTTYIDPAILKNNLKRINITFKEKFKLDQDILDIDDKICLGEKISSEINKFYETIHRCSDETVIRHFFELALIHSIKIVGRRDFELRNGTDSNSITPIFLRKSTKMINEMSSLPKDSLYQPKFILGSNHTVELGDDSVDMIITSPPYKDKDIEYQQIQIQRRSINRSKRSHVISSILGVNPLSKKDLCWTGRSGEEYWNNSWKSLKKCYRVLKKNKFAFFWIGFKSLEDNSQFKSQIKENNFHICETIPVTLSNDRAASGRSTHHGRKTGMMSNDFLFITKKT